MTNTPAPIVLAALFSLITAPVWAAQSDADVRQAIIQQSIASYSGACPCPYNRMRNGRQCGGNSAYSRPGGARPICYPDDVTDEMIAQYREQSQR